MSLPKPRLQWEDWLRGDKSEDLPPTFLPPTPSRKGRAVSSYPHRAISPVKTLSLLPHPLVVTIVACVCLMPAAAQDMPQREAQLGTASVVAQAERVGEHQAMPVQRADTAELRRRAVVSVADALRHFAGVSLRDYGGTGGLKTLSVRGVGAQHTLVAYDGIVLSDTRSGTIDLSRFQLDGLSALQLNVAEQPELLCPARQLGAAVLHLSALRPDTTRRQLQGAVSLQQGSFGLWKPALRLAKVLGSHHAVGLSSQWLMARNDFPFRVSNGIASHEERRANNRVSDWNIEANYQSTGLGWGSVSGKVFFSKSRRRLPGPVVLYVNDNDERLDERTAFAQMRYDLSRGAWQFFAAARGHWNESLYRNHDKSYPGGVQMQNYWQREAYVALGASWTRGCMALAYSADGILQSLSSNVSTSTHASRATLLQSFSLRFSLRRLDVTARALLQLHKNNLRGSGEGARNAGRLTPSMSLRWHIVEGRKFSLNARAYMNNVYRQPTFTESYYQHYGNPHLRPERALQMGAGMALRLNPSEALHGSLAADVYLGRVSDKIVSLPVTAWLWQTVNMGRVDVRGLDVTAQLVWTPAKSHRLGLHGNYTWQQVYDRTDKALRSYNLQLAYMPLSSGSVSVSWENAWLCLSAALTGCSSRWSTHTHTPTTRLKGFEELNISVWKSLSLGRRCHLLLRADLINALNTGYEIVRRYPMPRRSYCVSAELKF